MPAQAKLELLLTLKDRLKSGYSTAKANLKGQMDGLKNQVSGFKAKHTQAFAAMKSQRAGFKAKFSQAFAGMKGQMNRFKNQMSGFKAKYTQAFTAMKQQVPGLASALSLLTNPYVLVTAAVIGLSVAMWKGVKAAGEYNNQFLELRNLNLDKTGAQLDVYSDRILKLSLAEGFDSTKTAQGFYDVQSALGIYGDEVEEFVTKIGRFSMATKADFNDSLNSSTKAMKAFGFGVNQLDEYLASNAKTVQVGITTFNELAQVQTEYGGAAAAAGADFNTANKVFAAFTSIAKDSAMAATMTKAAFQGLTKKRTIEGLQAIGVEMFDATGKMRNLDLVLRDLVPAFAKLTDKEFLKMRNQIRGPEGLQNLFNKLRTGGDDLLATFKAFDNSVFDTGKALKNAKNDFKVLKEMVGNQFNNVMIRLGNSIMPSVIKGLKSLSGAFDLFKTRTEKANGKLSDHREEYNRLKEGIVPLLDRYDELQLKAQLTGEEQTELKDTINKISDALPGATTYFDQYGNAMDIVSGKARDLVKYSKEALAIVNEQAIGAHKSQISSYEEEITRIQNQLNSGNRAVGGSGNLYLPLGKDDYSQMRLRIKGIRELMIGTYKDLAKLQGTKWIDGKGMGPFKDDNGLGNLFGGGKKNTNPAGDGSLDDAEDGLKVVGDVKQVKNLTITIQTLHQGDNVVQKDEQTAGLTVEQLEEWYEEMMLRAIRNVEATA